jgi:hypothetical protein
MLAAMDWMGWIRVLVVAGLVGGFAGGLVSEWRQPSLRPESRSVAALTSEPEDLERLDNRLAAVERATLELERERRLLGLIRTRVEQDSASEGAAADAASDAPNKIDDPVFAEAVRDVVQKVDVERSSERVDEKRRKLARQWSIQTSQVLALSDAQASALNQLAVEYSQEADSLAEGDDGAEAPDPERLRAQLAALRGRYEQRLGGILDGKQMSLYQDLPPKQRLDSTVAMESGQAAE